MTVTAGPRFDRMTAELKADWVKALRSGEYKQAEGCLRSVKNEFCCLGVLADANNAGWQLIDYDDDPDEEFPLGREWRVDGSADMYYLADGAPNEQAGNELAEMNDSGVLFAEIAAWIEENVVIEEAAAVA